MVRPQEGAPLDRGTARVPMGTFHGACNSLSGAVCQLGGRTCPLTVTNDTEGNLPPLSEELRGPEHILRISRTRSQRKPMPEPSRPLRNLGFLTIGLFDPADPARGHESTLQIIELGERLGFDSAWLRHRHLQFGISSPIAVMAAATQRTRRIELGTAVIPLGWENPLRLAEDLATVDVLSGGRLNPGVSVGPPMHWDDVKDALYPDTADAEDFGYGRVE